jgi:hypothetical protein
MGFRLVSPSKFAVMTKHLPVEAELDSTTMSAGNIWLFSTFRISPT